MASVRCTLLTLPPTAVVCLLVVASMAATPGVAVGESLAAPAAQDSSADEASLALDRSTRRLIQQGLRNEGFDPGTPDGRFGLRTRASIRDWQQSRGASPTGDLNRAEAELLRTTAPPPPVPEAPPPPDAVAAVDPSTSSAAAAPASRSAATDSTPASPAIVTAEEADPQSAAETNTRQGTRAGRSNGPPQLPPEILVDRHLLRAERVLAGGDPAAALETMNEVLALQE
ncbi:MAG: peptidoglycan-binding domain-containing protein, partial [Acidobacteria bacterium]|nr:peptidoglycan-binding domain-containing protein [Acidobacteriota bacterium]